MAFWGIVAPAKTPPHLRRRLMFETVVVGADGSASAAEAVRQAIELLKLTGGRLHIVSAYQSQQIKLSGGEEFARSLDSGELADSVLADLSSRARSASVEVQIHGKAGAPADAICEVAAEVGADLIVVGNKGMKGVRRVLGSVPNSVAHQAPCSVLIVATT
jgi:nucleotide-binding universal stress UspA family protein